MTANTSISKDGEAVTDRARSKSWSKSDADVFASLYSGRKRHPSTVLSTESKSEMILATPLGSGVQPAILATQFQGRKSSTRFTG